LSAKLRVDHIRAAKGGPGMMRWIKRIAIILVVLIGIGLALGWTSDSDPAAMRAKYANAESEFLNLGNGLTVHMRDQGRADAPALVLVHGSNSSLHTWEPWVKLLRQDYRILTFDLPGHGLTGADPKLDYSDANYVSVVNRLLEARGIQQAIIGGNSMGGGIAWKFALAHPEKTRALLLLNASGANVQSDTPPPIGFRIMRMAGLRELGRVITPRPMIAASLRGSYADPAKVQERDIDRYWELLRFPGNRDATVARFAAFVDAKPNDPVSLAAIKVPTLILWGNQDNVLTVKGADWFAKTIPGSAKIVYDKVGHLPMEEIPEKSADDVRAFLSKSP
jgi:pimeloyl-ACP methyl ester carboxylesterase